MVQSPLFVENKLFVGLQQLKGFVGEAGPEDLHATLCEAGEVAGSLGVDNLYGPDGIRWRSLRGALTRNAGEQPAEVAGSVGVDN